MMRYTSSLVFVTCFIAGLVGQGQGGITETIKDFYQGCNREKNCAGNGGGKNCIAESNCFYAASVEKLDHPNQTYKIIALFDDSKSKYLAVGLGKSSKMINLAVLECIRDPTGTAVGHTSWVGTIKEAPTRAEAVPKIIVTETGVDGNKVVCTFQLPEAFEFPGSGIDKVSLKNVSYHIQLAWGELSGTDLQFHTGELASENEIDFNAVSQIKTGFDRTAYKLHGLLMTIVYMGLMPVGTIIARFYKETWTTVIFFKKKLWFIIHASLMCLSLLVAFIAYVVIPLQTNKWWPAQTSPRSSNEDHAILGVTSLAFLAFQSIGPWFIPRSKLQLKKLYYIAHTIQGLLCYVLGVTNIALASNWVPLVQPCEGIFVTCLWIAAHSTIYILLTTLLYIKDFELEEPPPNCRALTAYPMKIKTMEDAPGTKLRMIFLVCFIVISIAICISMYFVIYNNADNQNRMTCNRK